MSSEQLHGLNRKSPPALESRSVELLRRHAASKVCYKCPAAAEEVVE